MQKPPSLNISNFVNEYHLSNNNFNHNNYLLVQKPVVAAGVLWEWKLFGSFQILSNKIRILNFHHNYCLLVQKPTAAAGVLLDWISSWNLSNFVYEYHLRIHNFNQNNYFIGKEASSSSRLATRVNIILIISDLCINKSHLDPQLWNIAIGAEATIACSRCVTWLNIISEYFKILFMNITSASTSLFITTIYWCRSQQ